MPNLAATLKEEIRRLARKEVRAQIAPPARPPCNTAGRSPG